MADVDIQQREFSILFFDRSFDEKKHRKQCFDQFTERNRLFFLAINASEWVNEINFEREIVLNSLFNKDDRKILHLRKSKKNLDADPISFLKTVQAILLFFVSSLFDLHKSKSNLLLISFSKFDTYMIILLNNVHRSFESIKLRRKKMKWANW